MNGWYIKHDPKGHANDKHEVNQCLILSGIHCYAVTSQLAMLLIIEIRELIWSTDSPWFRRCTFVIPSNASWRITLWTRCQPLPNQQGWLSLKTTRPLAMDQPLPLGYEVNWHQPIRALKEKVYPVDNLAAENGEHGLVQEGSSHPTAFPHRQK